MKVYLTGLAARVLKTKEFEYSGKPNIRDLIKAIKDSDHLLNQIDLKISVNQILLTADDTFSQNDEVVVFNAFAGG